MILVEDSADLETAAEALAQPWNTTLHSGGNAAAAAADDEDNLRFIHYWSVQKMTVLM